MRTISRRAAITLFTGFVSAGLTFGVSSALAQLADPAECPIQPPDFLGRCPAGGVQECIMKCQLYGATTGDCPQPSNCCVCLFAEP